MCSNLACLVSGPMFRLLSTWHNHISSNSSSSVKIQLSQHVEGEVAENPIPRRHRASVIFVLMQKYLHASCASYSKSLQTWSVVCIKFSSIWLNYLRFRLNILIQVYILPNLLMRNSDYILHLHVHPLVCICIVWEYYFFHITVAILCSLQYLHAWYSLQQFALCWYVALSLYLFMGGRQLLMTDENVTIFRHVRGRQSFSRNTLIQQERNYLNLWLHWDWLEGSLVTWLRILVI